jgi:hypothetical protein
VMGVIAETIIIATGGWFCGHAIETGSPHWLLIGIPLIYFAGYHQGRRHGREFGAV